MNNTFELNGKTLCAYHKTIVVEFDNDTITLNTGGWFTATTKKRMNQASQEFNLGFRVYSVNYHWMIEHSGIHELFGNVSPNIHSIQRSGKTWSV